MARATTDRRRPNLDARITTRFDEVELAEVKARASKGGLAPSAFVRAIVLDFIEDDGRAMPAAIAGAIDGGPQGRSEELAELRVEVNRVGVNLNQVVREFNAGRLSGRDFREHEDLMAALGEGLEADALRSRFREVAAVEAASPEANASPRSPSSTAARQVSRAARVGLPLRE